MPLEQWYVGKIENEKLYYLTEVDRLGTAKWSTKNAQAQKFTDAVTANAFKAQHLFRRTDIVLIHTITHVSWFG